jgi:hypothetical protein
MGEGRYHPSRQLKWNNRSMGVEDIMYIARTPLLESFTQERNLQGWRRSGTVPFTKYPLWRIRDTEKKAAAVP